MSFFNFLNTKSNVNLQKLTVHSTDVLLLGLSSIWECRGISSSQLPSFYLCESCVEKLSIELICKHMDSTSHQLAYLVSVVKTMHLNFAASALSF